MMLYTPPSAAEHIPIIDLSTSQQDEPGAQAAAREIHKACRETGFFYIAHHGIDPGLIEQQFVWAQRFFALPLTEKLALHMKQSKTASGYEPIGGQVLDSQDASKETAPADLKEGFYCGMEPSEWNRPASSTLRHADNQWPPALPSFRDQMMRYACAMRPLADHLLSLLARSLDLPADWFAQAFASPTATLRLIKYPPQPENAAANQLGAGAHTDWGGITLLLQDDAGGLEVRNADGRWIEARPIPGTFVVNLGDLMARWTNGVYASNMHRVRNALSMRERYSVPFFYGPDPATVIEPMPGCLAEHQERLFTTCTAAEHMTEMFRRSYGFAPQATPESAPGG